MSALGDIVDDRVENGAAADVHGPGMHFDVANLAVGYPVTGREVASPLLLRFAHQLSDALLGQRVDVPDAH